MTTTPPFVLLGDNAFHNGAVVNSGLNIVPALCGVKTLLGELRGALDVVHADNNSLDGVADLDNVLDLDAVVGELGRGDEAGILGAEVNADLSAGNRNDSTCYLISIIYSFESFLQHFVKGLFVLKLGFFDFDFVRHFVSYLLNYPRGRGCPCREPDSVSRTESARIKLVQPFDKLDIGAVFRAYLREMHTVCTVLSADDDHRVTFSGKLCGLFLSRERSRTYCIRYFCVCTPFFMISQHSLKLLRVCVVCTTTVIAFVQ